MEKKLKKAEIKLFKNINNNLMEKNGKIWKKVEIKIFIKNKDKN